MINVIWYDQCKGNWDHGIFLETFEKYFELFPQINEKISPSPKRAIVIVAGKPSVTELRDYLETIESGIVILTSEEDAFFDWQAAIPKRFEIWTQYYSPSTKSEIKERVLLGAPYRIKDFEVKSYLSKKYLWSFVGQNQNPFRNKCVEVLSKLSDLDDFNVYLKVISGFGGYTEDGMAYQEYLDIMCQSMCVICPAGSMCVDSFRVYEAIECGAIPITDIRSPRDKDDFDYWDEVYPDNKLIQISDWDDLPSIILKEFSDYKVDNRWWYDYKKELEQKLLNIANG